MCDKSENILFIKLHYSYGIIIVNIKGSSDKAE